ncbi:MAG: geranylgeranylglyceryl/heptaprenylglyceryl phosphate synthase [Candidatus Diapherotrites archaeon]|nr:geranylgeranylglyceryl/heptaprenylglyceryl phosphate synthase [Candidatus Micrarchaeota archaeon]MBU1939776.1 geranylgeranylglyceryl/heptaprenylglyceryl phosphate synthase [Candidatus Micrarchaeota archaeon]
MKEGKVYKQILADCEASRGQVFVVIDPPNQTPEIAGKIAKIAERSGAAAIAVGGSVGAQGELLSKTLLSIKECCKIPAILFPGNIATLSERADAIYFMSMLNSLDPYYITGAQIASSLTVKQMGLEVMPTSYIIVEPGRAVGWVGRAKPVPRNLPYLAAITALAGQYMGSKLVILESGGGALRPAPPEMIAHTKKLIDIPLIVAGGVRTPEYAYKTMKAGADIIHVGTAVENTSSDLSKAEQKIRKFVSAAQKGAKERK